MKFTVTGIFIFLAYCGNLQGQSFDDIISKKKYVDCKDVSFNAPNMVHSLYAKGETDSLYSFLDYWQTKCGEQEYVFAIRTLLDIKTANFDSADINDRLFNNLIVYKERNQLTGYPGYGAGYEFTQFYNELQRETRLIASSIEQTYSTDEALITAFYESDTVSFHKIKTSSSNESKLKRLYNERVDDALGLPQLHMAFFLSYYQPFGKLEVFGPHMGAGGILGVNQLRHNLDFVIDIRFGQSANEYKFVYKGNLLKDDKWTSAYIGLEYTYDFVSSKKFRLGISPGIGYNGITAVPAEDDDDDSKILPALDINAGLSMKYIFGKNGGYIGLQPRFHWVDHRNPGGTELYGNYFSLRMTIGSIFGYERQYQLSRLDY